MYYNLVQSGDYPPALGKKPTKEKNVIQGLVGGFSSEFNCLEQSIGAKLVNKIKETREIPKTNHNNNKSNDITNKTISGKENWRREPPKDGEPKIKIMNGKTYEHCETCNKGNDFWTTGDSQHNTSQHDPIKFKRKKPYEEKNGNLGLSNNNNTNDGNVTGHLASNIPISRLNFGLYHDETDTELSSIYCHLMETENSFCQPAKLKKSIPLQPEKLQHKPTESVKDAVMVPNYISSLINQQNKRNDTHQKDTLQPLLQTTLHTFV